MLKLGYMGTKRFLAPHVAHVISQCAPGPVLDAFAGMGAVGEMLADVRPLWVNDIQVFASEVGKARFATVRSVPKRKELGGAFTERYFENYEALRRGFHDDLLYEREALSTGLVGKIKEANARAIAASVRGTNGKRIAMHRRTPTRKPYCLFASTYSGRFFSLEQAIQIDSIRYAIDGIDATDATKRWLLVALGIVLIRVAASTGHFAQYLKPKNSNVRYVARQRLRDAMATFWQELKSLEPVGSSAWRSGNRAFHSDAVTLLHRAYLMDELPSVVYADPPYTKDQYSRFYHLWETLVLYDYPDSLGEGCYRSDRWGTPFAIKSEVVGAMDRLASAASRINADFVLSYPANGLLADAGGHIPTVLKRHYRTCEQVFQLTHEHSTMGASKGAARQSVEELIFLARN